MHVMKIKDRDWLTQAQNIKLETFVMNLVDLFNEMDLDSSGTLTWHKFMIAMDNPRTQASFLSALRIATRLLGAIAALSLGFPQR